MLAYAPLLNLPLFEDDYPHISQSFIFGTPGGLVALLHDGVARHRATSYWFADALWNLFHLHGWGYHGASLLLHIVGAWLVYRVALAWLPIGRAALWAALFFAVYEGHQEAVVWMTAVNEPLQFVFGVGALWCWMIEADVAGVGLFALALLSKESAIIMLPLFVLVRRRPLAKLIPYAALAFVAVADIAATRSYSPRFGDGSFSLHAPFWITWPRSFARLLWVWGLLAAAAIFLWSRDRKAMRAAALGLVWIGIALVPYSFLTYSTQIPSRQTYLPSAGLALLFGLAVAYLPIQRRSAVAAMLAIVVAVNVGYLWTRKRRQYLLRAEPTEQLIRLARETPGPIWVKCFPRIGIIAQEAVHVGAGRPATDVVWTEEDARRRSASAVFCYQEGK